MKNPLVLFVGAAVVAVAVVAGATADRWRDWPTPLQGTAANPDKVAERAAEPAQEQRLATDEREADVPAPDVDIAEQAPPRQEPPEAVAEAPAQEPVEAPATDVLEPAEDMAEAPPEMPAVEPAEVVAEAPAQEPVEAPATDVLEPVEDMAEAPPEMPAVEPDVQVAQPERLAAADPRELEQAPEAATQPATQPAVPVEPEAPEPLAEAPSFDVVRLEDDGSLIAVGRAAPGADVALLLGGEVIATSPANEAGEWLIMPDRPLPPGSHQLTVEASDASGLRTNAGQMIALAVPERAGGPPAAVLNEPSSSAEADAEAEDQVAAAPEPVREEESETPPSDAGGEEIALATPPEPEAEAEAPVGEPEVVAAIAPEPEPEIEPERDVEQAPERLEVPLALDSVDYNEAGDIIFSGRGGPGQTVRIYVDGRFVGETEADRGGNWEFAGSEQIGSGHHALRADVLDAAGHVFGRIEMPFVRADGREVAALVESRRESARGAPVIEAAPEAVEAPVIAAAPEPAEAPVVAEAVAPEPEPEAPVAAETVAPEPEPEAPAVAEAVAPEPEPEAPEMAETVVPKTEPEAPLVAEAVAPEPEPEAPVVAEAVEPEPEAPLMAQKIAPEPEASVVVEKVVPEPEPEAPVVVEEVAPEREAPEMAMAEPVQAGEPPGVAVSVAAAEESDEPVRPGHVVIQPGNNLWRISRVIYGRGIEYTVIYEANRAQIRNPDLIYPGQIFATPGVNPPVAIDPDWRRPLSPEELARQGPAE